MEDLLIRPSDNLMKRLTVISGNIEPDKIIPSIWVVQITDIKRVLTNDLFNKILTDFTSNNLTGDYLTIYNEYVSNMLVFYSVADFITKNAIMITNGGNFKHTPEKGITVDIKETDRLSKYYRELGAQFELEFYEFMKDKNLITEYKRPYIDTETFKFGWQL